MIIRVIVFLLLVFDFSHAQITCILNPLTNTSSLFPNPACLLYYDMTFNATTGISTSYFIDNGTCSTRALTTLHAPFGICVKNYFGPQESCENYYNCLRSSSTYQEYIDCLPPIPEFIYVNVLPYDSTHYGAYLYTDENCTTPLSDPNVSIVPFGCMTAPYLQDVNGTNCNISQNIWPSNSADALS